ncbi:MAG: SpoIIE family protein phosphatase, partial [Clostridia bacterium]|nr:SpoIIE family protein phosphatase [Clostridia bacterium]
GLAAAALPERWARAAANLARADPDPCDPQLLAARLQRDAARRLYALGAAFGDLAEGYRAPVKLPDEQALIQKLRGALCAGCGGYAQCWDGGRDGGARLLCDLIARAVAQSGEAPLFEGEGPPELARRCRRGRLIPERLQEPLEDFAAARRAELRRGSENRLVARQFEQARQMVEGLARRQAVPMKLRRRQAARAAAALAQSGLAVDSVMALGGGEAEIVAALAGGRWTPALARRAAVRLEHTFGRRYAVAGLSGGEARFARRPRLRVETGVLCASREAGAPCGDSHLVCRMSGGRLLALICDGMGSGDGAARESATAVRLIGRFLKAGAPAGLAIDTVNALLLNRGGEEMFATVDMLVMDLTTGEARLTKLAACCTLIARDGAVRRVEGGRLPLGILDAVQPGDCRLRLQPGDVLLMASDGVMDAAGDAALEALLLDPPQDMRDLARRALDAAGRAAGGHRDDMTAVCLRVKSGE